MARQPPHEPIVAPAVSKHGALGLLLALPWLPFLVAQMLIARLRLTVAGDVLTYRSALRTRSWQRNQIVDFDIVYSVLRRPTIGHIYMSTADGECVTFHVARGAGARWQQERLQGWLAGLKCWLSDTPEPPQS